MEELVTDSEADYERLALDLARDATRLEALKQALADARRKAPLFDSEAATRHVEQAYDAIYQRWLAGEAPSPLQVPA
jgi:predicted O-linked N-acetylglucosamine transferase (SPINDLY family)